MFLFLDFFVIKNPLKIMIFKGLGYFSVSGHFWIQKLSINRRNEQILWAKSLFSRDFVISPVYRHFLDSKVSRKRENSKILWTRKMSRNREHSKILLIQKTWLTRGANRPFRCLDKRGLHWKAKNKIFINKTSQKLRMLSLSLFIQRSQTQSNC